jgi:CubicO group peptidase (beta-lactamase class C family)
VLPADWIEESWQPRTQSVFHDDLYGYGWFLTEMSGERVAYAWGYGGQMIYVAPELALTAVMTSSENRASARTGHRDALHRLMRRIVAAVKNGEG